MSAQDSVGVEGAKVNPEAPQITYYVSSDEDGNPDGLFRVVKDDSAQTLDMQYLGEDGWVDEPGLIEMLRDPGVRQVTDPQELMEIRKALYFQDNPDADADGDASGDSDQDGDGSTPAAPAAPAPQ